MCNWRDSAHPQAGGAELYCEEVARQLAALGARITYLTSRSEGTASRERVDFGRIVRLGGPFGTYVWVLLWLLANRRRIDGVIDSENGIPYFTPLVVSRRTPVVLVIHHVHQEQFAMYLPSGLATVGRWLEKWGARWSYGHRPVCVVSPSARAEVRRQLAFKGPIFIAPNGLTISGESGDVERSPGPRIVCVARLVPHKRLELLIDAVANLRSRWPDLEVHLIGDGDARPDLEKHVAALGLSATVEFHGRLSHADRDRLLASAWLTVNSTAGEGWGLSVIEAAALGIPAVAFRVPGMQDSVRPGLTGWLVDAGQDFSAAIDDALTVLADPWRAADWSLRCREWASEFTWESTGERILSVLLAEDDRLRDGHNDRRRRSDAMTVVDVPRQYVTPKVVSRLRRTDQARLRNDIVQILLGGADEHDAFQALDRLGVPAEVVVRFRAARHMDLLGWRSRYRFELTTTEDFESQVIVLPGAQDRGAQDRGPTIHLDENADPIHRAGERRNVAREL